MEINFASLVKNLTVADEEPTFVPPDVCDYVLENIYEPLCRGESVFFNLLDFSRFTELDLFNAESRAELSCEKAERISAISKHFCGAKPISLPNRSFC